MLWATCILKGFSSSKWNELPAQFLILEALQLWLNEWVFCFGKYIKSITLLIQHQKKTTDSYYCNNLTWITNCQCSFAKVLLGWWHLYYFVFNDLFYFLRIPKRKNFSILIQPSTESMMIKWSTRCRPKPVYWKAVKAKYTASA